MVPVLRPYQTDGLVAIRRAYSEGKRAPLYAAPTGSGKTVLFAHIAKGAAAKGTRVLILVHRRELLLQASAALTALEVKHGLIAPGHKSDAVVTVASKDTLARRLSTTPEPGLIVVDECFPAGTMVTTTSGEKPIEKVAVGDTVLSFDDASGHFIQRRVTRAFVRPSSALVRVCVGSLEVFCTPEHPFWVGESNGGWKSAKDLTSKDMVLTITPYGSKSLPNVPSVSSGRQDPTCDSLPSMPQEGVFGDDGENEPEVCQRKDADKEPNGPRGCSGEGKGFAPSDWLATTIPHGQRPHDGAPEASSLRPRMGDGVVGPVWEGLSGQGPCALLQTRHREPHPSDWYRSGRLLPYRSRRETKGREEASVLRVRWVDSPAVQEFRSDGGSWPVRPGCLVYNLEVDGTHSYIANGFVVHNCHHGVAASYRAIFDAYPAARLLGVTATPSRLDGKGLDAVFDALVMGPSMSSLIEAGYLAPYRAFAPPIKVDLSGLKTTMGDYEKHELAARVDRPAITGDAVEHYQRLCPGKRAIAFCVTVAHAEHTAIAFLEAGIPSESIDGGMDTATRDGVIERFRSGETMVLTSCELVSEGFDLPAVEAAILLRPTKSEAYHLQQCGRALRYEPGKVAVIVDHVGNLYRLGLPDEPREWSLKGREKRKGAPPLRRCEKCLAVFPPEDAEDGCCPECGAELPTGGEKEAPAEVDGELVELDRMAAARKRRFEEGRCQTLEELQVLARARGYKLGWAWHRWQARQGRRAMA